MKNEFGYGSDTINIQRNCLFSCVAALLDSWQPVPTNSWLMTYLDTLILIHRMLILSVDQWLTHKETWS